MDVKEFKNLYDNLKSNGYPLKPLEATLRDIDANADMHVSLKECECLQK